jgi:peptide/nickel transport system ATP-binding protein
MIPTPVLEGRNLTKYFWVKQGRGPFARKAPVHAVDNVSVSLQARKVTAFVGESGAGKTTVARILAEITKPDKGTVLLDGKPVPAGRPRSYARQVQMVFQDPFASLNPVHRVGHDLERPLKIHHLETADVRRVVAELLERVALRPPEQFTDKFPHELSGGQRQRVSIARALAVQPRVLIADEPVSMLDVSIRLGVLNLLADLRDKEDLAILYITHDIASARYLADVIVVMYAGQLVEAASSAELTDNPAHPYSQLLLSAAPDPDRAQPLALTARGAPPSLLAPPSGCRFHPRCPHAMDVCRRKAPPNVTVGGVRGPREIADFAGQVDHIAACWLHVDPAERQVSDNGVPASRPLVNSTEKKR